jgi:hypothetical protein
VAVAEAVAIVLWTKAKQVLVVQALLLLDIEQIKGEICHYTY